MVESQQKPYDTSLKSLLQEQAADMLPYLLPGSVFEQELNVEVIRPTMLTDRVYRIRYRGQQHILHLELETGSLVEMPARLLFYHAGILDRYALPVISMVVYPFRVSMAESPLRETSGREEILTFHFKTLPLWKLDARQFVNQHAISMYALLPTMGHASDDLLLQALQEMVECYRPNQAKLSRLFVWFGILLRRSGTISADEKRKVEERLNMYDNLLEEDPHIQEIVARAVEKRVVAEKRAMEIAGKRAMEIAEKRAMEIAEKRAMEIAEKRAVEIAEKRAESRTQNKFRETILDLVQDRFPALQDMVEQKIVAIDDAGALQKIVLALALASDEAGARHYVIALKPGHTSEA